MRRRTLQMAARLLEQRFNRDHSDHQGSWLPCACGRRARYVERRWKSFHSVVGELKLERAYYYCWECERGFCPRDRALGMDATSLSPAVLRMIGTVGAMVSFQEGSELLTELAGVPVDAKQVERTAEALEKKLLKTNAIAPNLPMLWHCRRPCIWAWTEPGSPYEQRSLPAAAASNQTDRQRPGK